MQSCQPKPSSVALLATFLAMASSVVCAQPYPTKPVRLIVPFPPGSGVDVLSRVIAPALGEQLGQQVVADNRGGASGLIGAELATKAPADGYTLLMATASMLTVSPVLRKVPYSVTKDFTYITQLGTTYSLLVVHPSMPATSVKQLIALAKAKPDVITYASTGIATPPHMAGELFKLRAGVKIVHVPYKGSGPAITDLLGGHVDMFFINMQSAMSYVNSKRVRPLAVTSTRRHELVPEVPTMLESGFKDFVAGNTWYGLLTPAGVPREVTGRLHTDMVKVLNQPDIRKKLAAIGATVVANSPEEFAANVQNELNTWVKIIRETGIKAE